MNKRIIFSILLLGAFVGQGLANDEKENGFVPSGHLVDLCEDLKRFSFTDSKLNQLKSKRKKLNSNLRTLQYELKRLRNNIFNKKDGVDIEKVKKVKNDKLWLAIKELKKQNKDSLKKNPNRKTRVQRREVEYKGIADKILKLKGRIETVTQNIKERREELEGKKNEKISEMKVFFENKAKNSQNKKEEELIEILPQEEIQEETPFTSWKKAKQDRMKKAKKKFLLKALLNAPNVSEADKYKIRQEMLQKEQVDAQEVKNLDPEVLVEEVYNGFSGNMNQGLKGFFQDKVKKLKNAFQWFVSSIKSFA
jgi:hypothetical protein